MLVSSPNPLSEQPRAQAFRHFEAPGGEFEC